MIPSDAEGPLPLVEGSALRWEEYRNNTGDGDIWLNLGKREKRDREVETVVYDPNVISYIAAEEWEREAERVDCSEMEDWDGVTTARQRARYNADRWRVWGHDKREGGK